MNPVNVLAAATLQIVAYRRMHVFSGMSGRIEIPLPGFAPHSMPSSHARREGPFFKEAQRKNASDDMPAPLIGAPRLGGAIKVLHIEDDPSLARCIARVLRASGFEVASAATRDEAIQHLGVHGFRPDVILTDYQLEMGVTGDAVVAEIASRLQFRPPTIMLTGMAGQQVAGVKSFADRTLAKPVDIDLLLREIENLLREQK